MLRFKNLLVDNRLEMSVYRKGISVLSMMDYHAVGSRRGGFEVARNVALVDERYRRGVIEWCVSRGAGHWEEKGREGVAKVLGHIFSNGSDRIIEILQQLVRNLGTLLI